MKKSTMTTKTNFALVFELKVYSKTTIAAHYTINNSLPQMSSIPCCTVVNHCILSSLCQCGSDSVEGAVEGGQGGDESVVGCLRLQLTVTRKKYMNHEQLGELQEEIGLPDSVFAIACVIIRVHTSTTSPTHTRCTVHR